PETGRVVVIEMNPRVSRSSALASKATGFPIAKIAARVAIGYTLDEIRNDITGTTPASFEPALDYVVVEVPRFAFEKFPAAGAAFSYEGDPPTAAEVTELLDASRTPTAERLVDIGRILWAAAEGVVDPAETLDRLMEATAIDRWFLDQMLIVAELAAEIRGAE